MKNILLISLLLLLNFCTKSKTISENETNKIDTNGGHSPLEEHCSAKDIMLLENKETQILFFKKLDSTLQKQYPEIKENTAPEINAEILSQFLKDIDLQTFGKNFRYQKKYDLKLTPSRIQISKEVNTIELSYDPKNCAFRIAVIVFYETKEFSDESSVVYSFKIRNKKLIEFKRQEAG